MCDMYTPKPILASNLEYIIKPANFYVISASIGALWCSQMKPLFKSLGSRHTVMVPLIFQEEVREQTQGFGST